MKTVIGCSLICLASLAGWSHAQTPAAGSLKEVTVSGSPDGEALVVPAAQYSGAALTLRKESTLGETLSGTPGVSSTYFGPNASRPIIRGQDGDRIRILQNGGASVDASGLSFDHAVTSDPLTVERIEVLRGPGVLQYGGSAMGGAVNVLDNRIPREPLFDGKGGITGKADAGISSGNRGRNEGLLLEAGTDRYALHADVFERRSENVSVPVSLACTRAGLSTLARQICNSAAQSSGGALGGSLFFDKGWLGASTSSYRNNYGTVAEDESTIRMRSNRHNLEGEWREPVAGLKTVKAMWARTDYQHTEFDAGAPQTTFASQGTALRIEARQQRWGALDGVLGYQREATRFSADGAEAFAPYSRSQTDALFAFEELGLAWGKLSLAARLQSDQVDSLGHPTLSRFSAASRRFTPGSYAAGVQLPVSGVWQVNTNLAWSERAPRDYELYANGPHGATGAYELGNSQLPLEQSLNLDLGLQYKSGPQRFNLSVFVSRFRNYISLDATGFTRDSAGNGGQAAGFNAGAAGCADSTRSAQSGCSASLLPEFAYNAVRARFSGLEAGGNVRLIGPQGLRSDAGGQTLEMELRGDLVRATNTSTGQPLPRIAPARLGSTLVWGQGAWSVRTGVDYFAAQNRVAPLQPVTAGYALWNAAVTWRVKAGASNLLWYARLDNIGNQLAYSATSILTQTAPGRAPLPGRNLRLGLQASF